MNAFSYITSSISPATRTGKEGTREKGAGETRGGEEGRGERREARGGEEERGRGGIH